VLFYNYTLVAFTFIYMYIFCDSVVNATTESHIMCSMKNGYLLTD